MINLLKEKDTERGLTLLEYIDWCRLYNEKALFLYLFLTK